MGEVEPSRFNRRDLPIALLAIGGISIVLVLRVLAARGLQLTLDETFTATITGQRHLTDFVREARRDVAAPLYYTILRFIPGSSNVALRLPSLLFLVAAAALPVAWPIRGQSRESAWAWSAMLFLWLPGAIFAFQARPYALLFLTATAQTIAFARLIEAPSLRRAFAWTACASLTLLTHYMSATLGLAQGLVLLAVMGRRALPLWPALLVLLIPAAEAVTHLQVLLAVATGDANWFPPVTFANLSTYVIYGIGAFATPLLLIALASRYLRRGELISRAAALAAISGLLAMAMLITAGWGRPLLVDRYLTACAPALILGLVTVAAGKGARLLLVGLSGAIAIYAAIAAPLRIGEPSYEWAAEQLIPARPARLVYSLGYKGQHTLAPETREALGAYFFQRAGVPTEARMVTTLDGRELVRAAGSDAAIIWIFYADRQPIANAIARERHCFVRPYQLACPALNSPGSAAP